MPLSIVREVIHLKFYISYFYKIRFFTNNIIPVSTAVSDPRWYHNFSEDKNFMYKDKNGVMIGIRMPILSPMYLDKIECKKNCELDPTSCSFLELYSRYLDSLDFNEITSQLIRIADTACNLDPTIKDPSICLIVHEAVTNPCSERKPLIDWFNKHGVELIEFNEELIK